MCPAYKVSFGSAPASPREINRGQRSWAKAGLRHPRPLPQKSAPPMRCCTDPWWAGNLSMLLPSRASIAGAQGCLQCCLETHGAPLPRRLCFANKPVAVHDKYVRKKPRGKTCLTPFIMGRQFGQIFEASPSCSLCASLCTVGARVPADAKLTGRSATCVCYLRSELAA